MSNLLKDMSHLKLISSFSTNKKSLSPLLTWFCNWFLLLQNFWLSRSLEMNIDAHNATLKRFMAETKLKALQCCLTIVRNFSVKLLYDQDG